MSSLDEIKIDISPPSNNSRSSKDDESRKELLWETREENVLNKWKNEMSNLSEEHNVSGRYYKKLYSIINLPATIIPIVLGGVNSKLGNYEFLQTILMILSGSLIGVSTFYNLGQLYSSHFEFENKYDTLSRELEKELQKPKRHRMACDLYMERIYLKYSSLNANAPDMYDNEFLKKILLK